MTRAGIREEIGGTGEIGPAEAIGVSDTIDTISDAELLAGFDAGTLPAASFHHREHVRVAWLCLRRDPPLAALERFCAGIQSLAAAYGKSGLYHATITWAFLLLIDERRRRHAAAAETWEGFAAGNRDLLCWQPSILASYYREETLRSDLARQVFLMPDRLAGGSPAPPA
jgi:hypothetical protein